MICPELSGKQSRKSSHTNEIVELHPVGRNDIVGLI